VLGWEGVDVDSEGEGCGLGGEMVRESVSWESSLDCWSRMRVNSSRTRDWTLSSRSWARVESVW